MRDAADYFDEIKDVKITKDMLDLAKHIVDQNSGHFDPEKFEDHYEKASNELVTKKQKCLRSRRLKGQKPATWLI